MLSKHRINENMAEAKQRTSLRIDHDLITDNYDKNMRMDRLHEIFHNQKNRYVFNPLDKSIGFNKRNASDYKMNKSIKLPKPLSSEKEFECEVKRREYEKAFLRYKSIEKKKKHNGTKTRNEPINLNKEEKTALNDIRKRIKNGELYITSTDKSSRFALLNKAQYLEAGRVHTSKDRKIDWNRVKYLQSQVNAHMWWLTNVVGYSKDKDTARMNKNIQGSSMEIPDMVLLVKDHKKWSPESKEPVPTRPVMSGNKGINSHLSEWLSEILEPIALNMASAEVNSTEEALAKIDELNTCLDNGQTLDDLDPLTNISIFADRSYRPGLVLEDENKITDVYKFSAGETNTWLDLHRNTTENDTEEDYVRKCDQTNQSEEDLVEEILFDLGMEAMNQRKEQNTMTTPPSMPSKKKEFNVHSNQNCNKGSLQTKILNYFSILRDTPIVDSNLTADTNIRCYNEEDKNGVFNRDLEKQFDASSTWARKDKHKWKELTPELDTMHQVNEMFDSTSTPVLLGADVKTLYPSLCPMGTAELAANALKKTMISFKGFDFKFLIVYLFLLLGAKGLNSLDLEEFIPVKKDRKCNSRSLLGRNNRLMDNWQVNTDQLSEKNKIDMISAMIKISTLVLMKTTCYSFGGNIYQQSDGAGIGLRASAALARIVMCSWDQRWAHIMRSWGLPCRLFIRYVDDIRVYVNLIKRGWRWTAQGWSYDENDQRDPITRTLEELNNSFDSVIDFLNFTTEWEGEFNNGFLLTLDMETTVNHDGKITCRFFRKPTCNNIVLQNGSCLPKNTIFSSLRQEVIRRLLHTSKDVPIDFKVSMLEEFIKLMRNSNHQYSFIKSVVMQGITKYNFMRWRSELPIDDQKFCPLHRARSYNSVERTLTKYANRVFWFSDEKVGDPFKQEWRRDIKRKGERGNDTALRMINYKSEKKRLEKMCTKGRKTTSTFFVPPSRNSNLFKFVMEIENGLRERTCWKTKVLEQPGIPLLT